VRTEIWRVPSLTLDRAAELPTSKRLSAPLNSAFRLRGRHDCLLSESRLLLARTLQPAAGCAFTGLLALASGSCRFAQSLVARVSIVDRIDPERQDFLSPICASQQY
jgi:hypothetical protein